MSMLRVLLLLAIASAVAVDTVTHRKLNGRTPAVRGSLLNQPSLGAHDMASLDAEPNAGLDSNAHVEPKQASQSIAAEGMKREAITTLGEAGEINVTDRQTVRHFLEVVPAPLRQRTVAALERQSSWLPEALLYGRWPKDLFAPYLVWSEQHGAYVSNTTNARAWSSKHAVPKRTPLQEARSDSALRAFLGGMARAELPPVITAGSLLHFMRQGSIIDFEDLDFMTFQRFLQPSVTKSTWWGRCMHPDMPVHWKFGEPSKPGYEIAYMMNGVKIDLFFAEEEEDYSSTGFWVKGKLYKCVLPGPTAFAPAMDIDTGARFFISSMALLNLEYQYGSSWDKPYPDTWHWAKSPAEFASCDLHHPRDTHRSFSAAADGVKPTTENAWDAVLGHLKKAESDSRLYKPGPEPVGGACSPW